MGTKSSRKIRIYLRRGRSHYSYCWIEFLKDKSFAFGLSSTSIPWDEFGTAVYRSGTFTNHVETLTKGNVDIRRASTPHVTFHPPRINHKSGIAHFIARNGRVDEWELDWFPVTKAQVLLYVKSGLDGVLEPVGAPKKKRLVVDVPGSVGFILMQLGVYPRSTPLTGLHEPKALGNVHGYSPEYIVSCQFYEHGPTPPIIYMASDTWEHRPNGSW